MNVLVDYLTFTAPASSLPFWKENLKLNDISMIAMLPRLGWSNHEYYNGLHVLSGSREDVCFELSGSGCRFLESLFKNKLDWFWLLSEVLNFDGTHVARLDIACDDRAEDNILDFKKMYKAIEERKYISKSRRKIWTQGDEQSIVFGSPKSDTRLRIYNKAMERNVDEHWIRCEFQLRNDSALSFILNLLQKQDIGKTYSGVLNNYLRFTVKAPDENNNSSRIATTRWWKKFLNSSEKLHKITVGGLEYNLETLNEYLEKNCGSSMLAYVKLCHDDPLPLLRKMERAKLNIKQQTLLNNIEKLRDNEKHDYMEDNRNEK